MRTYFLNLSSDFDAGVEALKTLHSAGYEAYFVGGCVRDLLLGRSPKDIDIATSARPDVLKRLFPGAPYVGEQFGVVLLTPTITGGEPIQIATFRKDGKYTDQRRPDTIEFGTIEDDSRRRDFTINALYYDPLSGHLLDFHQGVRDMESGRIRTVGDPTERFSEDLLRMLRAVRFTCTLQTNGGQTFTCEPNTWNALTELAPQIANVSGERLRDELLRILIESPSRTQAMLFLEDSGLLNGFLPEIAALRGVEQGKTHHPEGDVLTHTGCVLQGITNADPVTIMGALLHDVGKKATRSVDENGKISFREHEYVGAKIARVILNRLRFSGDEISDIVHLVETHMKFIHVRDMKLSKLRRFLGHRLIDKMMDLHRADCLGSSGDLSCYDFSAEKLAFYADYIEPIMPELLITGYDLIADGMSPGPLFKRVLTEVGDAQLEGKVTTKKEALEFARSIAAL